MKIQKWQLYHILNSKDEDYEQYKNGTISLLKVYKEKGFYIFLECLNLIQDKKSLEKFETFRAWLIQKAEEKVNSIDLSNCPKIELLRQQKKYDKLHNACCWLDMPHEADTIRLCLQAIRFKNMDKVVHAIKYILLALKDIIPYKDELIEILTTN